MSLYKLAEGCAQCRVCEGAAYQTPPVLFAGHPDASIIAIGQNPGEIKTTDIARRQWMHIFDKVSIDIVYPAMPAWYLWDFYGSPGYARLSKVFGKKWLFDGIMMWTNAVRCRTPKNAKPSKEMMDTCNTWTQQLLEGRKAIIMVGAAARWQVLGKEAKKLEWGVPKKHPRLGFILAIRHYSTWKGEDASLYKEAVKRVRDRI